MRSRFLVLGAVAALTLCGCDNNPSPLQREPLRPGADRAVAPSAQLPPGSRPVGYDGSAVPADPGTDARIGSTVPAAGGQQAQREKEQKALARVKEQWERERAGEPMNAGLPPAPQPQASQ